MEYLVCQDIENVIEILGMSQDDLALVLGVSRATVINWLSGKTKITNETLSRFYEYAFENGVRLNRIKGQFYNEENRSKNDVILFHGAKKSIEGQLSLDHCKPINDFGRGFYCGESLEQSAMFVASYPDPSLYILKFNKSGLRHREYEVDRDWMLMVAYHRGRLKGYEEAGLIKTLVKKDDKADYIIAPIADNRMYEIIDSFIDGEITDVQCQHCLSATDLGRQYVMVTPRALEQVTILEKCFLSGLEKEYYLDLRHESNRVNMDKVKLARKQYRNQGNYIEDILK